MPPIDCTSNTPSETTRTRLAFEACLPDIEAVPESEVLAITVDIPSTTATVLGVIPALRALAPELAKLPYTDATLVEKLEPRALALFEAHTSYLDATRPSEPIHELVAAGAKARSRLHMDAVALADRGLYDEITLAEYRGTTGYKVLAVDLNLLARGFRRRWADIEGKSPVTLDEIDHAEMIVEKLISAIGERERAPAAAAAATLLRRRAFTLVAKTYGALRRGVNYLRADEGDADEIAPSLFAGRGGSRRREEPAEAPSESRPRADEIVSEELAPGRDASPWSSTAHR